MQPRDPSTTNNISKLEDTQFCLENFTRQWNMGYQDILELTNCPILHNCLYFQKCLGEFLSKYALLMFLMFLMGTDVHSHKGVMEGCMSITLKGDMINYTRGL